MRADDYLVVAIDDTVLERWHPGPPEVTVVPFVGGSRDLPVAAARNAGAAEALRRGADLLVFLDVDCLPSPDLIASYVKAAAHDEHGSSLLCGAVAYLPPPPRGGYDLDRLDGHPTHRSRPAPDPGELQPAGEHRLFWSLSFAVTRQVWEQIGGFCATYRGYGAEDTDFGQVAKSLGIDLTWVGGAVAYHQWHPTSSPPVQHVDDILRNGAIFARRWGWWPMEGWLAQFVELGLIRWDEEVLGYRRTSDEGAVAGPSTGSGSAEPTGSGNGELEGSVSERAGVRV